MHAGGVPPQEERLAVGMRLVHEGERLGGDLLVDGLHALAGQRAGVLDLLARRRAGADDRITPRGPNCSLNAGLLRVVGVLRLLLGVEVVEVAEELVEAVVGRQHLVAVAEVVLAELAGGVAERAQQAGDGRILDLHALGRAGQADLGQAGADRRLAGDEGGAPGGAALLAVPVGEERAFLGDAVDVGRPVAHHAVVVGADVELADVVAPDDQDVRLGGAAPPARAQAWQGVGTAPPRATTSIEHLSMTLPKSASCAQWQGG